MGFQAAASVINGGLGYIASTNAANKQAAAATHAADLQLQEQNQVRADLGPYNQTGQAATSKLASFFGLNPLSTSPAPSAPLASAPAPGSAASFAAGVPAGYSLVQNNVSGDGETQSTPGFSLVDQSGNAVLTGSSPGDIFARLPTVGLSPGQAQAAAGSPASSAAPGAPDFSAELHALEATPGYQFTRSQGLKSVQNGAAARGLGISGAALKGAADYATGLAQNTYQANLLNPLSSLASLGENAAAQTGKLGTEGTASAGAGIVGAGNAQAAGLIGGANAIGGAANNLANYQLYNRLTQNNNNSSGGNSSGPYVDETSTF